MLAHQAGVVNDPTYCHGLGLSDHALSLWQLFIEAKSDGKAQTLQHSWCRHPAYKRGMENLCRVVELEGHCANQRSIHIKELMRDAAIHARDCMFQEQLHGKHRWLLRLGSSAKAVWTADHKLYQILTSGSDLASQHLVLKEGDILFAIEQLLKRCSDVPVWKPMVKEFLKFEMSILTMVEAMVNLIGPESCPG